MPSSRRRAMSSKIWSTTIGARPSDGSSSRSSARPGHQRAADREHLLLAARTACRPPARAAPAGPGRARARVRAAASAMPSRSRRGTAPSRRLSATVSRGNTRRPSGVEREAAAHDPLRRQVAGARSPSKHDPSAGDRHEAARRRSEQRRLAGAVGAEHGDDLALLDAQRHLAYSRRSGRSGRRGRRPRKQRPVSYSRWRDVARDQLLELRRLRAVHLDERDLLVGMRVSGSIVMVPVRSGTSFRPEDRARAGHRAPSSRRPRPPATSA